jgi:hypothetical protein
MFGDDLLAIIATARAEGEQARAVAPVDCPDCGTGLLPNPSGSLECGFDGWIWDGSPVTW